MLHNTWNLALNTGGVVITGVALGKCTAVRAGGELACQDLTQSGHGVVHHCRGRCWIVQTDNYNFRGGLGRFSRLHSRSNLSHLTLLQPLHLSTPRHQKARQLHEHRFGFCCFFPFPVAFEFLDLTRRPLTPHRFLVTNPCIVSSFWRPRGATSHA